MTPRFDQAVLAPDPLRRGLVLDVLRAAPDAVDPAETVHRHLDRRSDQLVVGDLARCFTRAESMEHRAVRIARAIRPPRRRRPR